MANEGSAQLDPMSQADLAAAAQLAVALGEAYRDAEHGRPTSPFRGEGVSTRVNVQTLTERLRTNALSNDPGETRAEIHITNRESRAPETQFENRQLPEQLDGIIPSTMENNNSSDRIPLSEVIAEMSQTDDYREVSQMSDDAALPQDQEQARTSRTVTSDAVRLAIMLAELYRSLDPPAPITPFEGDSVSVSVDVMGLINRLRPQAPPTLPADGMTPAQPSSVRPEGTSAHADFDGGIRVASSSWDGARGAAGPSSGYSGSRAGGPDAANASGTVTMRDPESSSDDHGRTAPDGADSVNRP